MSPGTQSQDTSSYKTPREACEFESRVTHGPPPPVTSTLPLPAAARPPLACSEPPNILTPSATGHNVLISVGVPGPTDRGQRLWSARSETWLNAVGPWQLENMWFQHGVRDTKACWANTPRGTI